MKISIIMSTFNSESFVKNSIDSLLLQTYKDYEILILDDNSTDSTYDILKDYERDNSSVKIFKNDQHRVNKIFKYINFQITCTLITDRLMMI